MQSHTDQVSPPTHTHTFSNVQIWAFKKQKKNNQPNKLYVFKFNVLKTLIFVFSNSQISNFQISREYIMLKLPNSNCKLFLRFLENQRDSDKFSSKLRTKIATLNFAQKYFVQNKFSKIRKNNWLNLLQFWSLSGYFLPEDACKSCGSRQELSNEYLLAKIGVDSAENELLKVWKRFR